jgi:hypothetical protein
VDEPDTAEILKKIRAQLRAKKNPPKWKHPKLGLFHFEDGEWEATIKVPGYKAFAFVDQYSGKPDGKFTLTFYADSPSEHPSDAAITLAQKIVTQPQKFTTLITQALWKDITGKGVNSGMWWHNNLVELRENMEAPAALFKKSSDLLKVLRLYRVQISDEPKPTANFSFRSYFEPEHAVGVLINDKSVLGIGYAGDPEPFES